jgi:predicted nucleic acid-binding protein
MDVQGEMVGRGTHRAPSTADLILAACAEVNGLVVLHYDHDFELISDVTGQPIEWIASAGSIP